MPKLIQCVNCPHPHNCQSAILKGFAPFQGICDLHWNLPLFFLFCPNQYKNPFAIWKDWLPEFVQINKKPFACLKIWVVHFFCWKNVTLLITVAPSTNLAAMPPLHQAPPGPAVGEVHHPERRLPAEDPMIQVTRTTTLSSSGLSTGEQGCHQRF